MISASFLPVRRVGLALVTSLGLAALPQWASAATLTVDSNADTGDVVPGDGTCGSTPNTCTLRAAIQEANGNADASNTIVFAAGMAGQTTTAATAYPAVTKPLTITGPATRFTLDGNAATKSSLLRYTGSGGTYAVSRLNLTNGSTTTAAGGGCVYFAVVGVATLSLSDMNITACRAASGVGGGIAIDLLTNGSTATLSGLQLGTAAAPNTAANGGGLAVRIAGTGSVTLLRSSVVGNTATANGGGIYVKRGRLTLAGTTISANSAATSGGGIFLDTEAASGGNLRMENVTVASNSAATGGGIGASSDNPTASWVTFSTIAGNTGSGIRGQANPNVTFPGTVFNPFTSNIIAANTGGNCAAAFSHADAMNSGFNLSDDTTCGFTQPSDRIVAPADLKLAALAANPSAPNTRALLAGSAAIDAGNTNWVNATTLDDQRGAGAQDGNLDASPSDPVRDIGAYEFGGFGLIQFSFPGASNNFDVDEDRGTAPVLIRRYGTGTAATTAPTVAYSTSGGTATAGTCDMGGSDYTALASNPMNFAFTGSPGATQFERTANMTICKDSIAEGDETFNILLAKPTGADPVGYDLGPRVSGTVTIKDSENGTFQFNPTTASGNEGNPGANGSATLTITRTVGTKGAVRVTYSTRSTRCTGTCNATDGVDYTTVTNGTVDFADGETSKTVSFEFLGDTAFEANETFEVQLGGVACLGLETGQSCDAILIGDASNPGRTGIVTITNDDVAKPGSLQFAAATLTANEADGTLVVTVRRVGGADGAVTVTYGATDGTASSAPGPTQDYAVQLNPNGDPPGSNTVTWPSGDSTDKTFSVTLVNDANRESDKTFTLNLSNPTGGAGGVSPTLGTPASTTVTLVSDEQPRFQFSVANGAYSIAENGGMITLTVTADAFTGPNVTVPYFTRDVTATSPVDYTGIPEASSQTLVFSAGDTSKTITIPIISDSAAEGNETFQVHLGTPLGGGVLAGTNPATVTIVDPTAVRFTAANFNSASEANGSTITFSAERIGSLSGMVTVGFTISQDCTNPPPAGCAEESTDYTRASSFSGTFQWNDNEGGAKSDTISIIGDSLIEGDETIRIVLNNPSMAVLGTPSSATATIRDDDYRFEIVDASPRVVAEGAGNATVQVRRFGSTLGTASVSYATANGTATAGSDYTATASPPALSWAAGEGGIKTISVPITDDAVDEPTESFTLALSSPSNNVSGQTTPIIGSPLTVQITDNDAVTVSFSAASQTVNEGVGTVTVTATRTGATTFDITVPYTVSGTATNPADHNAANGSITILAGSSSGSATFTVTDDSLDEPDETVIFTMGTPSGGDVSSAAPATHTVTITDNDSVTVSFSAASQTVGEGVGTVTVTATRTGATSFDITVPYTVSGTAANPADHNAASGSITILAANSSGSTTFTVVNDAIDETDESVVFTMGTPSGGTVSATAPTTHTVTIADDDVAGFLIVQSGGGTQVTEGGASDTITVQLTSQPLANVTITPVAGPQFTFSPASLTFTPGNFNVPQTVTITAVDDDQVEPTRTDTLSGNATSADPNYNRSLGSVTVTIIDNDSVTAGEQAPVVVVTPSGGVGSGSGTGGAFSLNALLALLALFAARSTTAGRSLLALLALLVAAIPLTATAKETKAESAAPALTYDHVDLRYISVSLDTPSVDASGYGVSGSWSLNPQWYASAGYGSVETDDFTFNGATGSTQTGTLSLGLGWHRGVGKSSTDFVLEGSLLSVSASGQGGFTGDSDDTGFGLEAGFRGAWTPKAEWGASLGYVSIFSDTDTSLVLRSRYRLSRSTVFLADAGFGSNSSHFGLGVGFNF